MVWTDRDSQYDKDPVGAFNKLILTRFPDENPLKTGRATTALDLLALWIVPVVFFIWGYITYRIEVPRNLYSVEMWSFMCVIYMVPTWIMLRNNSLHGLLRYFFGLTIMPIFLVLLIWVIGWFSNDMPGFAISYESVRRTSGGGKGIGILVVIPTAFACWLWYRFLLLIDRFIYMARKSGSQ